MTHTGMLLYSNKMDRDTAIQNNKVISQKFLSERSQTQKTTYNIIPFVR